MKKKIEQARETKDNDKRKKGRRNEVQLEEEKKEGRDVWTRRNQEGKGNKRNEKWS